MPKATRVQKIKPQELTLKKYNLVAKTPNQKIYIKSIHNNQITFCVGPAGTGKTHIAVASGIIQLMQKRYEKIVITRPFVQAGEDTGFLPGDIAQKADPYIRPIYDELNRYCSFADIQRLINGNQIEILPFAYMRGRNLHNSFIIADECQNATFEQITMLLTRIGQNSTMVITGDLTQSDLKHNLTGGLQTYINILSSVESIGLITLTKNDIVRSPIVELIVKAVEDYYVNQIQKGQET